MFKKSSIDKTSPLDPGSAPAGKKPPRLRPNNPHGNSGYHPSTKDVTHEGYQHTSEDR